MRLVVTDTERPSEIFNGPEQGPIATRERLKV